jgi:hypothetical protein
MRTRGGDSIPSHRVSTEQGIADIALYCFAADIPLRRSLFRVIFNKLLGGPASR